eukprot:gene8121-10999_t
MLVVAKTYRFARSASTFRNGYPIPKTYRSSTSLRESMLQKLMDKEVLSNANASPIVFVGGKGGVGKTSSSSAIALALSDAGYKTLIISTDPAHSLGDALDVDLTSGSLVSIPTESNLWALEIDVDAAIQDFKQVASDLDSKSISASLGVPKEIIDSLGLDDLTSLFKNPPPGIDEIVALVKIYQLANKQSNEQSIQFDRIVVDTAPTGHTIRLLQLPVFLASLTTKVLKFRSKLMGAMQSIRNMFGGSQQNQGSEILDKAMAKIDDFQTQLNGIKSLLKDKKQTQFVIVTIPTKLAVLESKRLVEGLIKEDIYVSSILCNQVLQDGADTKYIARRALGQKKCIENLSKFIQQSNLSRKTLPQIEITEVPYVDTEVTGVYGLRYFKTIAHPTVAKTASNPIDSRKVTLFGGKGGVGKTTSAASWAVQLSDTGFRTLVVSTDPAHSLGDALQENLNGEPRLLDSSLEGGELWGMEVDPVSALDEFRTMLQSSVSPNLNSGGMLASIGLGDLQSDLADMVLGVKDPPPGTDEVVALTNIIRYLDDGFVDSNGRNVKFDRVVIDTAPTGHTLRMLELPQFLQTLLAKVSTIREKTKGVNSMMNMMGGSGQKSDGKDAVDETQFKIAVFNNRMQRLDEILHSPKDTEFSIVTIPTDLAVSESKRLLTSLIAQNILTRRILINQVIPKDYLQSVTEIEASIAEKDTKTNSFLNRLRAGQRSSITELEQLSNKIAVPLIQIPYFDTEVRTVYGLRVISRTIFPPSTSTT